MRKTVARDIKATSDGATLGAPQTFMPRVLSGPHVEQKAGEKLLADFLPKKKAAIELDICEQTLDRWRRLGEGPPITKIGRRVYYRRSTLQAWLCAREQQGV
jgi:hypothetical protein